jgi:hypothetical protein
MQLFNTKSRDVDGAADPLCKRAERVLGENISNEPNLILTCNHRGVSENETLNLFIDKLLVFR